MMAKRMVPPPLVLVVMMLTRLLLRLGQLNPGLIASHLDLLLYMDMDQLGLLAIELKRMLAPMLTRMLMLVVVTLPL